MANREKLPKIADASRESQYGYVFGVSGPGMNNERSLLIEIHVLFV